MEDKLYYKDLDNMIDHLKECKQLAENQVKTLCDKVRNICFEKEQKLKFIYFFKNKKKRRAKS